MPRGSRVKIHRCKFPKLIVRLMLPAFGGSQLLGRVLDPSAMFQQAIHPNHHSQKETVSAERAEKERLRQVRGIIEHLGHNVFSTRNYNTHGGAYMCMSDLDYRDSAPIGPGEMADLDHMSNLGLKHYPHVRLWEIFAGSGALSARANARGITHLPPVDHRWGVGVGKRSHQLIRLNMLFQHG